MDSQHATCTSCNHSFRLPAGASADSKCPRCGGAVALTPARTRSAKPEAAAPARTRPARATAGEEPKSKAAGAGRSTRRGAHAAEEKNSPAPLALGGAGAVVVLIGVWFFAFRGEKEAPPAIAAEAVQTLDLSKLLPDQKPLEGTTDEEWAAMNELMTRYCTPPFIQATSVPHGDRLVIRGMRAVPVILNGYKRLDLATDAGAEIGWKVQTLLLQGLCHDTNFGWRRETRPADILFNQQVIQRWFKAWEVAGENAETWAEIARLKDIPPGLQAPAGTAETPAEK